MNLPRLLEKYQQTRAAGSHWSPQGMMRSDFAAVVVIPALAEKAGLPETLQTLAENPRQDLEQTLVIVIVNNRKSAPAIVQSENRDTLEWLRSKPFPGLNLAWIDAASTGYELPEGEGVGLARKIGFDAGLCLLDWSGDPLLISLDADTLVDRAYLPAIFRHFAQSAYGGCAIPFRHQPLADPHGEDAIRDYELYLRSYLFGLQAAGSPYAYHTIGSAFACRAAAYLAAGGMNRRLAAEDFYFLQQLAKCSGVELLQGTCVQPSPRFSERVPFGTGQVVRSRIEEQTRNYRFVAVQGFRLLQSWLMLVAAGWDRPAADIGRQAAKLSPELAAFLDSLNFPRVWQRLQDNHRTREQRVAAFHCWFDALRTRQLLTRGDVPVEQTPERLVAELLSWGGHPGADDKEAQLHLLERLQGVV